MLVLYVKLFEAVYFSVGAGVDAKAVGQRAALSLVCAEHITAQHSTPLNGLHRCRLTSVTAQLWLVICSTALF